MAYLLDASIWIAFTKGDRAVARAISGLRQSEIIVPTIVEAELYVGTWKSNRQLENMQLWTEILKDYERLPFTSDAAHAYSRIRAATARIGSVVGAMDLLIAASALAHNHTVATRNVREFERIPGLSVEAW